MTKVVVLLTTPLGKSVYRIDPKTIDSPHLFMQTLQIIMLSIQTQNVLLFLTERWTFLESGIPLVFFSIKLILPGPGFEPVTSRVAGRRCPCTLSYLTQVNQVRPSESIMPFLTYSQFDLQTHNPFTAPS